MNNTKKIFFIVLAIIAALGVVFLTIGGVMGGFSIGLNRLNFGEWNGSMETIELTEKAKVIDIDGERVDINIEEKEIESIEIEVSENIKSYANPEGNTIKVDLDGKRWKYNECGRIDIFLPKDYELDELKIDLGVGKLDVQGILATELDIEVGVGEGKLENVQATNIEGNVSVGSLEISGDFTGDVKLECGVGDLMFSDEASLDEFHRVVEIGLGSVDINGEKHMGSMSTSESAKGARLLEVECGLGRVEIELEE